MVAFLGRGARSKGCFVSCIREPINTEQREASENRETEISATATNFYVGIRPNPRSIARVLASGLEGGGGGRTKFSMGLTSGNSREILILI